MSAALPTHCPVLNPATLPWGVGAGQGWWWLRGSPLTCLVPPPILGHACPQAAFFI